MSEAESSTFRIHNSDPCVPSR